MSLPGLLETDMNERIYWVDNFFKNHLDHDGTNYGVDVIKFMEWEVFSIRLGQSEYWTKANGAMIEDMMMAQQLIEEGNEHLANPRQQKWIDFINNPSQSGLWTAHNDSINFASLSLINQGYLHNETAQERAFIASVLFRVNGTETLNFPSSEGWIDLLMNNGPTQYPAGEATWDQRSTFPFYGFIAEDNIWRDIFENDMSAGKFISEVVTIGTFSTVAFVNDYLKSGSITYAFSKFGSDFIEATTTSPPRIDPLILDLDGNGITTTNIQSGAFFDFDRNGFAERSGWVNSNDGLLVLDRNGDGIINNGAELFGDQTPLRDGTIATNGFNALADLDVNGDGNIDISDSSYSQIKIWRDINGDGYSSTNELFTLEELGIKSINTVFSNTNTIDSNGNTLVRLGSYEKTDGTTGQVAEFLLQRNTANTIPLDSLEISDEIRSLPNVQCFGDVYTLHQSIARDTSGTLKSLVELFVNETDVLARKELLNQILYKWTGSDGIDPTRSLSRK